MRTSIFITVLVLMTGCVDERGVGQVYKMPVQVGEQPVQLITYDDQPVIYEYLEEDGGEIYHTKRSVYVDATARLVFKNGLPILTYNQFEMYWGLDGEFYTTEPKRIQRGFYFTVDSQPLDDNTALYSKALLTRMMARIKEGEITQGHDFLLVGQEARVRL